MPEVRQVELDEHAQPYLASLRPLIATLSTLKRALNQLIFKHFFEHHHCPSANSIDHFLSNQKKKRSQRKFCILFELKRKLKVSIGKCVKSKFNFFLPQCVYRP